MATRDQNETSPLLGNQAPRIGAGGTHDVEEHGEPTSSGGDGKSKPPIDVDMRYLIPAVGTGVSQPEPRHELG